MNNPIIFRKVKEDYGWLSNMSPHPVNGFRTAEALFQAMRFPLTASPIVSEIQAAKIPDGRQDDSQETRTANDHAPKVQGRLGFNGIGTPSQIK